MILLDTHTWLWLTGAKSRLSRPARRAIEATDVAVISAISAWELAMLARKRRVELDRPAVEWVAAALTETGVVEVSVTARIAACAGDLGDDLHGDLADRIIAATALELGATLVTKDERLRALPMLNAVW